MSDLKSVALLVRLSPAEKAKVDVVARAAGVSQAEVFRQLLEAVDLDDYRTVK